MYTEDLYTDYFEKLATNLADIGHSPTNERFFINHEMGNGLNELKNALNGTLGVPCLVLDEEEIEGDGSSPGQKMSIAGGFAVLDKVDPSDITSIRRARQICKSIARKIINKMKRDSRASFDEQSPLLLANAIQLGEIHSYGTPVLAGQLAGWAVEFRWLVPDDITFGMQDFS